MKRIILLSLISFYSFLLIAQPNNLVLDSLYSYKYFKIRFTKNSIVTKKVTNEEGFDRISYQFFDERDTIALGVSSFFYKGEMANIMNDAKEKIYKEHVVTDTIIEDELGEKLLAESGLYKKIVSKVRVKVGKSKIDAIKFNCLADIDNIEMLMMIVITFRENDPQTQIFYLTTNKKDTQQDEQNFERILKECELLN